MKEEEPVDGKKSEDDGIEKENLAILEKIRKNQRQDHLNVSAHSVGALLFICFPVHIHTKNCVISFAGLIGICGSELCVVSSCVPAQGAVSGSVQASDRLMKELREIYRSQSYKTGERADLLHY